MLCDNVMVNKVFAKKKIVLTVIIIITHVHYSHWTFGKYILIPTFSKVKNKSEKHSRYKPFI